MTGQGQNIGGEITMREQVDEALAPTAGRHEAEQLRVANDAARLQLAQQGYQVDRTDIMHLHLAVLLDTVLGDMDDPRRQAYELAVHTKMAGLLADVGTQIARARLTQGIPGVVAKMPTPPRIERPGGRR